MGADLVTHSTTKFLSGQGNAVGGVVIDAGTFPWLGNEKFPSLSQPAAEYNGITFAETFGNDLAYTLTAMRLVCATWVQPCLLFMPG